MAAFAATAANVRPLEGARVRRYNAGGTITPGQAVYLANDGDVEAADADVEAQAQVIGICIADGNGAVSFGAGTRVDVVVWGPVTGYASLTPGGLVYASVTAGSMDQTAPAGASGDFPFVVGYAESATTIFVSPQHAKLTAA